MLITNAQDISGKANRLKIAHNKFIGASNKQQVEIEFFQEFPNSFNELNTLYGFNNDTPAILYDEAPKHILEVFNNIKYVNDTIYYQKLIALAIGGKWEADAINYFQDGLINRVTQNINLTCFTLKKKNKNQIRSFWYFYFDGPHPKSEIAHELLSIKKLDADIFKLLKDAHKDVLNYWKNH